VVDVNTTMILFPYPGVYRTITRRLKGTHSTYLPCNSSTHATSAKNSQTSTSCMWSKEDG